MKQQFETDVTDILLKYYLLNFSSAWTQNFQAHIHNCHTDYFNRKSIYTTT
jgi:hypothetical protein